MRISKGFTILELAVVIAVISIIGAMGVLVVTQQLEQAKFDATVAEMNNLKKAMLGDPELVQSGMRTSFGYVGDMGALPPALPVALTALVAPQTPAWTKTSAAYAGLPDLGTGAGWRGPYIDDKKDSAGTYLATLDEWGNAYQYNNVTGQITSGGPDGLIGTAADNIVIPETSVAGQLRGGLTGQIRGKQGELIQGATVTIYYPNTAGNHTTLAAVTDANGQYSFADIPMGKHTVSVTINGSAAYDTAVIEGNQTLSKNLTVADVTAPAAPTASSATPVTTTAIRLGWTASTSVDVASYNIYRSQATGTETLFASGVKGTSYLDTSCATGGRYFYKIAAVDYSGNVSPLSTEISTYASPVQQNAAMSWNGDDIYTIPIKNGTATNILISGMTIVINKTSGGNRQLKSISIGGPVYWNGSLQVNGTGTFTLQAAFNAGGGTYTLTPAGTPNVILTFDNNVSVSSMTLQFNTQDGFFYVF